MAGRRTNLALLVLLLGALASGTLAFALGTRGGRWVVAAHGIVGLAIVALTPWKSVIVRRGLGRRRTGTASSLAFLVLIMTALVAGVLHTTGIAGAGGALTAMQVHVGAALLAVPLAAWHVRARRVRVHRTDLARRQLMRSAALLAGTGAAYAALEGALRATGLPGGDRRFTGSHERGSLRPEEMPVTQWLDDDVPDIDASGWRLRVAAQEREGSWTRAEIDSFGDVVPAVLDCTGGWWAAQEWQGAFVSRLVEGRAGRSITVTSATGYRRRFPAHDAGRLLLATRVGGEPLSPGHGAPARLVVPGRRGFWWVKWVSSITVDDVPWWLQLPFPLS
jgi:DMSO/TMAO reductase YedYZ molybdopterin-dependent catalytic subunit